MSWVKLSPSKKGQMFFGPFLVQVLLSTGLAAPGYFWSPLSSSPLSPQSKRKWQCNIKFITLQIAGNPKEKCWEQTTPLQSLLESPSFHLAPTQAPFQASLLLLTATCLPGSASWAGSVTCLLCDLHQVIPHLWASFSYLWIDNYDHCPDSFSKETLGVFWLTVKFCCRSDVIVILSDTLEETRTIRRPVSTCVDIPKHGKFFFSSTQMPPAAKHMPSMVSLLQSHFIVFHFLPMYCCFRGIVAHGNPLRVWKKG